MQTVLSKAARADVVTDPYPYIVIENAVDDDLYEALCADFPGPDFFVCNEQELANTKFTRSTEICLESPLVGPAVKDFMRTHTSAAFFKEVVDLFGPEIRAFYPNIKAALGKDLADLSVGLRRPKYQVADMSHDLDLVLDCQVSADYTFTERAFRGPHVDSSLEIYAGLLYLRDPRDDSTGGSLGIWRAKDESKTFPAERTIRFETPKAVLDLADVEQVGEVPYKANTLVMFINSWRSLHCAQTRSATIYPRRHLNIIGEICRFPEPDLFDVERPAKPRPKAARRSFIKRAIGRLGRELVKAAE